MTVITRNHYERGPIQVYVDETATFWSDEAQWVEDGHEERGYIPESEFTDTMTEEKS